MEVVGKLVDIGLGEAKLFRSYLVGGATTLIKKFVDTKCVASWSVFREAMEAGDFSRAKAKLKLKSTKKTSKKTSKKSTKKKTSKRRNISNILSGFDEEEDY